MANKIRNTNNELIDVENIYKDISFVFENLNRRIEVYGNKSTYEYNSDKSFYENFTWEAIPNLRQLTITVT